jgi:hypothetical protein
MRFEKEIKWPQTRNFLTRKYVDRERFMNSLPVHKLTACEIKSVWM